MNRMLVALLALLPMAAQAEVRVSLDTAEAESVLRIAEEIAASGSAKESSWQALFATNGYRDLLARETAMGREFTESDFRAFVASGAVVNRRAEFRGALETWRRFDVAAAARSALAYLPEGASIEAVVYPLIKPKPNSFVFNTGRGRAIFLYLDPAVSGDQFQNTVVHEMHHIGFDTACEESEPATPLERARRYLGGFGEGIAMLAAAGGATIHPHASSRPEARATWERDYRNVAPDMKRLEKFFLDLAEGRLVKDDDVRREFMSFIATEDVPQGAFYSVGWHMASTIERARGRKTLVALMCDRVAMMRAYNEIVATDDGAPRWSGQLLERLSGPAK